ncbi:hypothetical protein N7492_003671 [Penicillium capsulatum]|uniref:Carrier domain-containing protein n=1 Tax=Penicillium capsulatum TaxID=69766 RepID=A0A9W9LWB2_9EURO|nr:hypothetical protein N7492_003671 [Penicillium capsulatum]
MGSIESTRTVLRIFDSAAANTPEKLYCVQPISSDISQGWAQITFGDLSNAINRMAYWIKDNVVSSDQPETLAYIGANDVRYVVFSFACMRLRLPTLLLSTRNPEQASLHVMNATGSTKLVYSSERSRQIEDLKAADASLQAWEIPGLWEVLDRESKAPVAPPSEPAEDHEDRGIGHLPTPENRVGSLVATAARGKLCFVMSPLFHLMGILSMVMPILFDTPFALGPERPLTAELLEQIMKDTDPKTSIIGSSILEELSASELGLKTLSDFEMVFYGGSPLAIEAGNRITEVTHLQSVLGTSECGIFAALKHQDKADWAYLEWNPNAGMEMRDAGEGLFELVVRRGDSRAIHPVFHTYPEKTEYLTGDLFAAHPEKPGIWLYSGRRDDIIVLSNGEKFNPTTMEEVISAHPLVARTIVIGQGRFQSAVIIEPAWSTWNGDEAALIDEVWPTVKKANESAPAHAQLMKNRVGVASESKPFQLTPKGSIKRRAVESDYKDEINAIYDDSSDQANVAQIAKDASPSDITAYITSVLSEILDVATVDENADIFALGVDSLQTLRLGQILQASLQSARPDLGAAFGSPQLYSLPTIVQLTQYISGLLQGQDSAPATGVVESDSDRETRISDLVGKYSGDLGESHAVIVTGTTGSLGAYLLYELLRDLTVTKIYCLNRSADAAPRQLQSLREKGLASYNAFPQRVEFLQAQFGSERLGLDDAKYEELLQSVDTIIHNAWKVNFNHKVEAFENPHIEGVRRLVEFSIASERTAHIHFISSISTIEGYSQGPSIPEIIFNDPSSVLRQGYGESKHVAERICAAASAKCGVPSSIHRVGQIGGPTTAKGMWNKQEWLPSLVATSKTLKQVPATLGSVSVQWVPVDVTAKVITDIVRTRRTTQEDEPCEAFHIVNPKVADWKSLIPAVTKYFDVEPVDIETWIASLESFTSPTEDDLRDKPALKILDFFKAIAVVEGAGPSTETTRTEAASKTLRQLEAIDAPLVENWMKQWDF